MNTQPTLSKFHKWLLSTCAFMAAMFASRLFLALVIENHAAVTALSMIPGFLLSWYVDGLLKKL